MSIVKMKKISVIGLKSERMQILDELARLGVTEISLSNYEENEELQALASQDTNDEALSSLHKEFDDVKSAIAVIEQYGKPAKSLFKFKRNVTEDEFSLMRTKRSQYQEKMHEILSLYDDYKQAEESINKAQSEIFALNPWRAYPYNLDNNSTKQTRLSLGVFPADSDINSISNKLSETHNTDLEEISRDKEQIYCSLLYFANEASEVLDLAKSLGFSNPSFVTNQGTVSQAIASMQDSIKNHQQILNEIKQKIQSKSDYLKDFQEYYDILNIQIDQEMTRSNMGVTTSAFEFEAYVPSPVTAKLEQVLDKFFCNYEFTDPSEDEDVPVLLKNKSFFAPSEFITEMYSLPSYKEIDPTSIFTLFYILFFGIMFGDVGYGLLLILGSIIAVKGLHMNQGASGKLMKIIFYSGISSTFWGFMFGSIFGDMIPVIAKTFFDKTIVIKPLWLDPAKEPMVFLIFSCGLGVVHLFVGMGVKAYQEIKDGHFLDACNDVFVWYLIVLGLVMWLFGGQVSEGLVPLGKWMAIAGFALAMILPVFVAKGAGKALGIWNIYSGVTGNLSDILSYSRLLGLGLASTSIAGVFNFLASMGGKSVVGIIMFVLIFLVGHSLNFAINALGAFVHSCRLQYVEFFGKFYEGGGKAFTPLKRNTKYINIV